MGLRTRRHIICPLGWGRWSCWLSSICCSSFPFSGRQQSDCRIKLGRNNAFLRQEPSQRGMMYDHRNKLRVCVNSIANTRFTFDTLSMHWDTVPRVPSDFTRCLLGLRRQFLKRIADISQNFARFVPVYFLPLVFARPAFHCKNMACLGNAIPAKLPAPSRHWRAPMHSCAEAHNAKPAPAHPHWRCLQQVDRAIILRGKYFAAWKLRQNHTCALQTCQRRPEKACYCSILG